MKIPQNYKRLNECLEELSNNLSAKKTFFSKFKKQEKGFYIYGSTGSGKTTIMNHFFKNLQAPKLNIHFHDYFIDITRLLVKYSMTELVKKISSQIKVLCFDEFFIESIADARLLQDIMQLLIKNGVTIVLTSNFSPEDLYKNGFNRQVVFPYFSNFIHQNLHVYNLSHNLDFREELIQDIQICKISLSEDKGEFFNYTELFASPKSANDYIALCRKFDVICITNFRSFNKNNEDELIRFRNFIDIAYIRHTKILLEFKGTIEDIFEEGYKHDVKIKRTYSRLCELSSSSFFSMQNLQKRAWQNEARIFLEEL